MKDWFIEHRAMPFLAWYEKLTAQTAVSLDDDYLQFQSKDQDLLENFFLCIETLSSSTTLSKEWLEEHQVKLIAQSIDGNYLLGNETTTWVVPVDLHLSDIEEYTITPNEWVAQWIEGTITSNIL